jgi:hypothetical protein
MSQVVVPNMPSGGYNYDFDITNIINSVLDQFGPKITTKNLVLAGQGFGGSVI